MSIPIFSVENVPGVSHFLGFVSGSTVRSRNAIKDFTAAFGSMFGGEVPIQTKLLSDSRNEAIQRMKMEAQALGATAVIGVRIVTSHIPPSMIEVVAYGTAVVITF
jgi:uncharacterized protein YbjQ (UPF0145 family)